MEKKTCKQYLVLTGKNIRSSLRYFLMDITGYRAYKTTEQEFEPQSKHPDAKPTIR